MVPEASRVSNGKSKDLQMGAAMQESGVRGLLGSKVHACIEAISYSGLLHSKYITSEVLL